MKNLLIICALFIFSAKVFGQQNKYPCPCNKIGLNAAWTDSSKISCYLIPVEKDLSKSSRGKFYLAAVIVPSLSDTKEAPLLYLHGGPGIATLENIPKYLKSKTWITLRQKHALVFFDYRGTGFSEPELCLEIKPALSTFSKINPDLMKKKDYKVLLYKNCKEQLTKDGIDLTTFSASQLAFDAESIRVSLGIDTWNVYGVSFGTTVALNMMRNHSEAIKAIILDSPFPPNAPWLDFVRPFDTCFRVLENSISADPIASSKILSLRLEYVTAVTRLNKAPIKIKYGDLVYDYTGADFAWDIWKAMLSPKTIPLVPLTIKEVANGNDSLLLKWVTLIGGENSFGKFSEPQSNAIMCFEGRPRKAEDSEAFLRKNYSDFESLISAFDEDVCNVWRPDIASKNVFDPVISNIPTLILSGEFDPVCPPYFGDITAQTLSNSTHIVIPSASHAAIHIDDCDRNIAANFLLNPFATLDIRCMNERMKINFVTNDLMNKLNHLK